MGARPRSEVGHCSGYESSVSGQVFPRVGNKPIAVYLRHLCQCCGSIMSEIRAVAGFCRDMSIAEIISPI